MPIIAIIHRDSEFFLIYANAHKTCQSMLNKFNKKNKAKICQRNLDQKFMKIKYQIHCRLDI